MGKYEEDLKRLYQNSTRGGRGGPMVCPGLRTCKLCAIIRPILNFQNNYDTATVETARRMQAQETYFSNVCFHPDYSKVILFGYGTQIGRDLSKLQIDPAYAAYKNFAHPTKGRLLIVDKSIGSNQRPQYSVTPQPQIHKLPKLGQIPHNLKDVEKLLASGIEVFRQAKLEVASHLVRMIGYGKDQTKFFSTVVFHWGISEDEFAEVQRGVYNPFQMTAEGSTFDEEDTEPDIPDTILENVDSMEEADFVSPPDLTQVGTVEEAMPQTGASPSEEEQPPCFGKEYDPDDDECSMENCSDWVGLCKEAFIKRYGG